MPVKSSRDSKPETNVRGSILGAASIWLLENLLTILQVNQSWLQVVYGMLLVFAVVLSGVAQRGEAPA